MQVKRKGQALVELAVFGSIFLMILGAMLSYGLHYNYMQQAQQLAYRRAMKIASDPNRGSGSYMLITDKHVPDPGDPFGIGSTVPIVGSASVTRTGKLDAEPEEADYRDDLPLTVVDVQSGQHNSEAGVWQRFTQANGGFRHETAPGGSFSKDQVSKYMMLYGDVHMPSGTSLDGSKPLPSSLRITDSCSGEAVDYRSCYQQAAQLVDNAFCRKQCDAVNSDPEVSCGTVCSNSVVLNPPNQVDSSYSSSIGGPWYAANYVRHDADSDHPGGPWFTFPVLDELFKNIGTKAMGLQSDVNKDQARKTSVQRHETSGAGAQVVTQEDVAWSETNTRNYIKNNNLDPASGREISRPSASDYTDNVETDAYVSNTSGDYREVWTTGK